MTLSFSDTHPFPTPVYTDEIKKIYSDLGNGTQFAPITVRSVSNKIFHELYRRGHRARD